jgi:hypothetical protein
VQPRRIRAPRSVTLLLAEQPGARASDERRVDRIDGRHVDELHEPVRGQHLVGRRLAEPGEAAAFHFVGDEALVALADQVARAGAHPLHARRPAQEAQHEEVRVRGARGLLEASVRLGQHAVEAVDRLVGGAAKQAQHAARGCRGGG